MKSVIVGFIILIFNISMSIVSGAALFNTNIFYESEILGAYQSQFPTNASASDETQQLIVSSDILATIFNTLTWNWVNQYIPAELQPFTTPLVTGLNIISVFIMGIGIVELFWRRRIFQPGGN